LESKLPFRIWEPEVIPSDNILVHDTVELYLPAEVYTGQLWPSATIMENMVESACALALDQRNWEKEEYYRSRDQRPAGQAPSLLPDAITLEIISPLTQPRMKITIRWVKVV